MWPFRRRLLFRYHNGRRRIAADPVVLYRRVLQEADELSVLASAFDAQKEPEATEFVEKLAGIFGLSRWDPHRGEGLTDFEVLDVFRRFNAMLQEVRERFFSGSTPPPVSDGASSSIPESPKTTPPGP